MSFHSRRGGICGIGLHKIASPEGEAAGKGKRVIILSNSLNAVRKDAELYRGDLIELTAKLYKEGIKHIWVDGGITVSQFLLYQLVDNMTISIVPTILGDGIPLFNVISKEIPCRLVSSPSYSSGLVQLNYEIACSLG